MNWIKSTVGKIVSLLVIAALGFLVVKWYIGKEARADAERAEHQRIVQAKDDSLAVSRREKATADSALANAVPVYLQARSAALTNPARPATPEVRACFEAADKVISACQIARTADSVVIAQQASLIGTLRNPPPKGLQRVQAFGEALYDFANTVPVIRAGATAKIPWVPIHLSVAGEYAAPKAGSSDPAFRALAGLRINF